jgi:hypothetical protein
MNLSTLLWMANVAEHQIVQLALTDSKGDVFYTDDVRVHSLLMHMLAFLTLDMRESQMTVKTSKVGSCVGKPAQFSYLNLAEAAASAPTTQIPAAPAATIGPIAPVSGPSAASGQGIGAVGASTKNKDTSGASSTAVSFGLIALASFATIFVGAW